MTMAKWILPALLAVLTGCGDSPIDQDLATNYGYGYEYEFIDAVTGVRVRYHQSPSSVKYSTAEIVFAYEQTKACTGLSAPGPLVIVADMLADGTEGGIHYHRTGTIVIADAYSLRHEMIHYLLQQTGFPREDNNQHRSPLFVRCHE